MGSKRAELKGGASHLVFLFELPPNFLDLTFS
jgi:hypothetical protein